MMDDSISRQWAIDAVLGVVPYDEYWKEQIEKAVNALPSAQSEIVRCKDCKWYGRIGCAISIVDDSDKPTENDFCSFAERRTDGLQ